MDFINDETELQIKPQPSVFNSTIAKTVIQNVTPTLKEKINKTIRTSNQTMFLQATTFIYN